MKDNTDISATGANTFKKGFNAYNLDRHWTGGDSDHSKQYQGYTKEQYAQEALALVQSPVNETVKGYKNELGQVVRYDTINENFVKGHPEVGISTMFKPIDKEEYFKRLAAREAVKEEVD